MNLSTWIAWTMRAARPAAPANSLVLTQQEKDFQSMVQFFFVFTVLALLAVLGYQEPFVVLATALLWAMACLTVGAAAGFIFGVPKVLQEAKNAVVNAAANDPKKNQAGKTDKPVTPVTPSEASARLGYAVNTNLTEISDWLTKIIVGVGLVELKTIPDFIRRVSTPLATSLDPGAPRTAEAAAITVCFTLVGFLFGYLCTRVFLAGVLYRADNAGPGADSGGSATATLGPTDAGLDQVARVVTEKIVMDPAAPDRQPEGPQRALVDFAAKRAAAKEAPERQFSDWYVLASDALTKGSYTDAIHHARQALDASSDPNDQWQAYNLLGLANHYLQPPTWKKGDSLVWFDNAIESYNKAILISQDDTQKLLSTANLSFVYLDVDNFSTALQTARLVLSAETPEKRKTSKVFELARVSAGAAAAGLGRVEDAVKYLTDTRDIEDFDYLVAGGDISDEVLTAMRALPGLPKSVQDFLATPPNPSATRSTDEHVRT
jgi:hypothetical protein